MKSHILKVISLCGRLEPAAQLLARVAVGFVFLEAGWGKLTHLDRTIEYFASLGIPFAQFQAPFAAATEFGCGALLLLGLATRFASIPLIVIMLVAIRTAKWEDISGLSSLLGLSEFLFIVLLVWLIARGAGSLSLDHLIKKKQAG